MPQFVALTWTKDVDWSAPEHADEMKEYGVFGEIASGAIRGGGVLQPSSTAVTVRVDGGRGGSVATAEGPYARAAHALTGYYVLEAADLSEAVTLATDIPAAWDGAVEVRPLLELPPASSAGD